MESTRLSSAVAVAFLASFLSAPAAAQWFNYPTPGTPRLSDGSPDLSAPAPRTADGKPDLSGVWRGAGPLYRFNIAQDLETEDIQPWAEELFLQRVRDSRRDSPLAKCLPVSVPFHNFFNLTRIVQTPALTVILYEAPNSPHRTVFTDGRDLPEDPNPNWLGYSVGQWERDTLVVTTAGFNDRAWLDSAGHPQTESLRITERYHRRDFGHMDFEMTIDDPTAFTSPFTVRTERLLAPDTDLLEYVCDNERDAEHMVGGSGIILSPELVGTYAGVYELASGREVVVTVTGDLLFVQGLNEPKLPLIAESETQFLSTATSTGFEFVKDAQGRVTRLIMRGRDGEQEAVRRAQTAPPAAGGERGPDGRRISERVEPFTIVGNIHYVGGTDMTVFLITTPEGHILIDSTYERDVPWIRQNIEELGFDLQDIRVLLNSHAHGDHIEAHSLIKELTGGQVVMSEADGAVLAEGGGLAPTDSHASRP